MPENGYKTMWETLKTALENVKIDNSNIILRGIVVPDEEAYSAYAKLDFIIFLQCFMTLLENKYGDTTKTST